VPALHRVNEIAPGSTQMFDICSGIPGGNKKPARSRSTIPLYFIVFINVSWWA